MKKREKYFLSEEKIPHDSEPFDYIAELHEYLWRFIRVFNPGASGNLDRHLDDLIELLENVSPPDLKPYHEDEVFQPFLISKNGMITYQKNRDWVTIEYDGLPQYVTLKGLDTLEKTRDALEIIIRQIKTEKMENPDLTTQDIIDANEQSIKEQFGE